MGLLKNPKQNKENKKNGCEVISSMNHLKFMEIDDQVNFSYPSCLLDSHSQYVPCHTIFNLFCIHVLGGVDEGLQVLILFNVCVAIAWDAPNVPTKCPRVAKINFKLTIPKGAFTFLIFILQATRGDPVPHGFHTSLNNCLLVISSLNHMHIT